METPIGDFSILTKIYKISRFFLILIGCPRKDALGGVKNVVLPRNPIHFGDPRVFGFGDGFPPERVFRAGLDFQFGFRFWVPKDSLIQICPVAIYRVFTVRKWDSEMAFRTALQHLQYQAFGQSTTSPILSSTHW